MKYALSIFLSYGVAAAIVLLAGGTARPAPVPEVWSGPPRFDAPSAYRYAAGLAEGFPYRPTGSTGAEQAAHWLVEQFAALGLQTGVQEEAVVLEGRRVLLRNVYAVSPGTTPGTIVIVANHDMAPTSYQAASDTAGGVGVLLELARIFAREPHQRELVFLAPDGEEWGLLGARAFARDPPPELGHLAAALVVEDLAPGQLRRVIPTMNGQFRGFTPLWLRELARRATLAEGLPFADPPPALEYADRAVLIAATDQGPFLAKYIPTIELTTTGDNPALQARIYHAPEDVMGNMRVEAFHTFGRIAERMIRTLDAGPIPLPTTRGDFVRLSDGRIVAGFFLMLAQWMIFLPLLVAIAFDLRRVPLRWALLEFAGRFVILAATYGSVLLLPSLGLLPASELYPPPPRHPVLYRPDWVPFLVPLAIIVILSILLGRFRPRTVPDPEARRAGALATLGVLAWVSFYGNAFAATIFLALPAWLWIWIAPGGTARKILNIVLLLAGWAVVAVLIQVQTQILQGANLPWYFLMGTAYGQFRPEQWLPTLALLALWTQLVQVGLGGRIASDRPELSSR